MLDVSEQDEALARLRELVTEQAALRRVATLVAGNAEPSEVFARVCAEVGAVLEIESTNLTRFEGNGTQTVLAGWSVHGAPVFPVGRGVPIDGKAAVAVVRRSGNPARVDDYSDLTGELPERIRRAGIASAVAVPITVAGNLWGALVASSGRPRASRRTPKAGWPASRSWWPMRLPTPMPGSSSPLREPASSRSRTQNDGASSATCTTVLSSGSSPSL